ncbi:MAG: GatB/YqeY domain-containing protein [Pseudomonadota bacterium]|uniref:GatB/YqeY domain-containing protein n=1 Tax=Candidatus Desulfatibia profunda TaxID=2841695 RepID=A0A8J6NUR5_9BACT|nr:GatB/YqeY domain-containing protein [Candidatus Desulfatibia profunda]MBL7180797.1 GatB/YqeY domain-containing protein [Desulfobacterales bacterium]
MKLQERIKKDLAAAIKAKDEEKKSTLRVILGEFGRLEKKELSDEDAVKILRKLIKAEKEVLEIKGARADSEFIIIIENYLPKMATEAEIRSWIEQHVDFSKLKNKMQAMGQIMKHFGAAADGNAVKNILQQM